MSMKNNFLQSLIGQKMYRLIGLKTDELDLSRHALKGDEVSTSCINSKQLKILPYQQ